MSDDTASDVDGRFAAAVLATTSTVVWHQRIAPGGSRARLTAACDELGVDT